MKSTIYFVLSMLCMVAALMLFLAALKSTPAIYAIIGVPCLLALGYWLAGRSDQCESFFQPY